MNIKNVIIRNLNRSLFFVQGKKQFQWLFKGLYYLAMNGLNYGKVHSFESDGELFQLKNIKDLLSHKKQIVVFDVGANEGHYSNLLLNVFGRATVNLHLFEPSRDTFSRLSESLSFDKAHFNNIGFSDKCERVTLYRSNAGSDYASLYKSEKSDIIETIELSTVDTYCDEHGIEKIDFLKIDVEGHEFKCLLGATRMLNEGRINFIQFEFGVSNIYSRVFFKDIYDLLSGRGYQIGRVLKNGLSPIHQYHPNLEVFLTTNYIAWLKPRLTS